MYNRKNTATVLIFAVMCLSGVVLMALGGYDKDEAFTRCTLAMVATEGWMYAYNKRLDRSKWTKWIVRITIIFQALIGLLMCFSPFESHYAIGSVHFLLSLAGAVIWTVFSVLMSCVLYHTDRGLLGLTVQTRMIIQVQKVSACKAICLPNHSIHMK